MVCAAISELHLQQQHLPLQLQQLLLPARLYLGCGSAVDQPCSLQQQWGQGEAPLAAAVHAAAAAGLPVAACRRQVLLLHGAQLQRWHQELDLETRQELLRYPVLLLQGHVLLQPAGADPWGYC
jgi:hypothetical protein